jgi:hypothetical protein
MKKLLIIKADTNDGDYIHTICKIDEKEEALIRKVAKLLHSGHHNWETSEYCDERPEEMYKDVLTQEEIETFDEYVPYGEHGVHTIASIRILEVTSDEDLL